MYYSQADEKLDVNEMSSTKIPQNTSIYINSSHFALHKRFLFPKACQRNPRSGVNKAELKLNYRNSWTADTTMLNMISSNN